jgi:trimeric autotransporter adhesin
MSVKSPETPLEHAYARVKVKPVAGSPQGAPRAVATAAPVTQAGRQADIARLAAIRAARQAEVASNAPPAPVVAPAPSSVATTPVAAVSTAEVTTLTTAEVSTLSTPEVSALATAEVSTLPADVIAFLKTHPDAEALIEKLAQGK